MQIDELIVYTLDMPKFVYVQVTGVEKPAKIRADKVEKLGTAMDVINSKLVLKIEDQQVAEFRQSAVQGWWIEDEPDEKK